MLSFVHTAVNHRMKCGYRQNSHLYMPSDNFKILSTHFLTLKEQSRLIVSMWLSMKQRCLIKTEYCNIIAVKIHWFVDRQNLHIYICQLAIYKLFPPSHFKRNIEINAVYEISYHIMQALAICPQCCGVNRVIYAPTDNFATSSVTL